MKLTSLIVLFLLAALFSGGCAASHDDHHAGGSIATLRDYMVGSFSTARQAEQDPENFRDIRMEIVQIWPDRTDGTWLYVEQAVAGSLDKPYRQRMYRLSENADHTFTTDIYTFPEPALRYAGAWQDGAKLAALTPALLTHKDGCAITLTWHHCREIFSGGTTGAGCESTVQGAAYAGSEVSISPFGIITWDRGFDAHGNQVWGATETGYAFVKRLHHW